MSKFVRFKSADTHGDSVFIKPEDVSLVERHRLVGVPSQISKITLNNGVSVNVTGIPVDVIKIIDEGME